MPFIENKKPANANIESDFFIGFWFKIEFLKFVDSNLKFIFDAGLNFNFLLHVKLLY